MPRLMRRWYGDMRGMQKLTGYLGLTAVARALAGVAWLILFPAARRGWTRQTIARCLGLGSLFWAGQRSERIARLAALAVPLLDVPVVFFLSSSSP